MSSSKPSPKPAPGAQAGPAVPWQRVLGSLGVIVFLPALLPYLVLRVVGMRLATRARYWVVYRWWPAAVAGGACAAAAVHVAVVFQLVRVIQDTPPAANGLVSPDVAAAVVGAVAPLVAANFFAGVLLLPIAWVIHRRRVARLVMLRRVPDVAMQESIETARIVAADLATAHRMGVRVDRETGQILGQNESRYRNPYPTGEQWAFGLTTVPTIRSLQDRFRDVRRVRDWVDKSGRIVQMPLVASAVRAILLAESGTGKTVLLNALIFCALKMGWPVIMLDAKGDPADARQLVARARAAGHTAEAGGQWNMFGGTPEQITAKLMRLMPPPDGANQHYLKEVRGILQNIQGKTPLRSLEDLQARVQDARPHVRSLAELGQVDRIVDSKTGETAGHRVLGALSVALRPLDPWISPTGWNYGDDDPQLRVVSLLPVDDAQAILGDLLLVGLRHHMSTRLSAGDKTPMLVIVDEFPQLITAEADPGDTAASLFETARSAGMGLVLAAQSAVGLSNDETRRRRALSSGAALLLGRSKDPEETVKFAGSRMRMEASGAAEGDDLRSARAQHTYVIPPQVVREAPDGAFWLVQAGGIAAFRAMPPEETAPDELADGDAESAPADDAVTAEEPTPSPVSAEDAAGDPFEDQQGLEEPPTVTDDTAPFRPVRAHGVVRFVETTEGVAPPRGVARPAPTAPRAAPSAPRATSPARRTATAEKDQQVLEEPPTVADDAPAPTARTGPSLWIAAGSRPAPGAPTGTTPPPPAEG
ncbi:hypothetical protein [Clavibacter zhangzhiyongii]|uniref:hypothetical protein n=1 Tax=Clavibacter zhangzhiyongii TaxID=2768071 RepID=UPI0019561D41|nr:hypothetical protein [Clavibacter zhangzhiyongii]MBM7024493.1 hypothetical protein [Clavibacter zhangzhiyongii]